MTLRLSIGPRIAAGLAGLGLLSLSPQVQAQSLGWSAPPPPPGTVYDAPWATQPPAPPRASARSGPGTALPYPPAPYPASPYAAPQPYPRTVAPPVAQEWLDAQMAQRCNVGRLMGGLFGGAVGYGASRGDGRSWAVPLGALLGQQMGCNFANGRTPVPW